MENELVIGETNFVGEPVAVTDPRFAPRVE